MHRRFHNRSLAAIIAFVSVLLLLPGGAKADAPYSTFTRDNYGRMVPVQPAYRPIAAMGHDLYVNGNAGEGTEAVGEPKHSPLKGPQDVFVGPNDDIYIADTGNDRIVHLNRDGILQRIIQPDADEFDRPSGIYVTGDGTMYVADTGNGRIVKLNAAGDVEAVIDKPVSRLIPESFRFDPVSVVVDRRGFLYVATKGGYQGLMQLDGEGTFYGFFGTNRIAVSWLDTLRYRFYTEEQLRRQERLLPDAIHKADIDASGFIYTASVGSGSEQLKKLNIGGDNLWDGRTFGAVPAAFGNGADGSDPVMVDMTVDDAGFVTAIDRNHRVISQYDRDGRLLFYWTGTVVPGAPQLGVLQSPAAIAADSKGRLLVLDDQQHMVTVFEPTEFGALVHQAFRMLSEGRYEESERYWEEIVRLNAHFSHAYEGLSEVAFHRENYGRAMEFARLSGNPELFSESLWYVRLAWLQRYFAESVGAFALLGALFLLRGRRISRSPPRANRRRIPPWAERIRHAFALMKHPIDGFADLRYAHKGSYPIAFLLLGIASASLVVRAQWTGFAFRQAPATESDIGSLVYPFLAAWIAWVVCHYLIGSVTRGEGRFKDVFIGSAYALVPIPLVGLPATVLSNVLTLNEASMYAFLDGAMMVWCLLLFFWMSQGVHNYSVGEAFASALFTAAAMLALGVLTFTIFGLASELVRFVYAVVQEVTM